MPSVTYGPCAAIGPRLLLGFERSFHAVRLTVLNVALDVFRETLIPAVTSAKGVTYLLDKQRMG